MTPIRLLLVQANPPESAALALDVEQRNLQDVIAQSAARRSLEVYVLPAARIGDLPAYLRRHAPHIVHFACHGDGDGGLWLNAPGDARGEVIGAAHIAAIVAAYQAEAGERLRLAVVGGCWTEQTARILAGHVDWTAGFDGDVPDEHLAAVFTPEFYAALGDGRSAPNAVETACSVLRGLGWDDTAQMICTFMRTGVTAGDLVAAAWTPVVLSPAHLDYLKEWFIKPWANIPLADILEQDGAAAARISLLDVYVPLRVDFGLLLQTQGGEIADWWADVEDGERAAARALLETRPGADAEAQKPLRTRTWPALGVGEAELRDIVTEIGRKMKIRQGAGKETEDGEHRWYMEAHDAASVQGRFVLLGEPGSGKSSFLRHLALCLAGELRRRTGDASTPAKAGLAALRDWLLDACTPIYVELRELAACFPALPVNEAEPPRLPAVEDFWRFVGDQVADAELTRLGGELRTLCDAGRAILLLDGLDEVPQGDKAARRKQVQALIGALAQRYPQLRIVIASRPHAYRRGEWALAGFGVAELRPLSLDRLGELAHALFPAVLGDDEGRSQADAFIAAVEEQLKDKRIERSFYANPLFFTLLAGLWLDPKGGRRLPETRAELYRRAVDLLLLRWTRRRLPYSSVAESLGLAPPQLRSVLETLACSVHEQSAPGQDTTRFHVKELLAVLYEAGCEVRVRDIPDYLSRHTGLLTAPEHNWFYFTHRSFQEHLAACELICSAPDAHLPPVAADRRFPAGIVQRLHARPELWENVFRLAADELAAQGRRRDLGALLADSVRPYLEGGQAPAAAALALAIGREQNLFAVDAEELEELGIRRKDFGALHQAAARLLVDWEHAEPEGRNAAGELLGLRPEHDTRRGIGLRADGLPDIDWVEVPEADDAGQREFTYQEGERRVEPAFWMARYPVTSVQFQAFVDALDGYRDARWWEGLDAPAGVRAASADRRFPFWNHPRDNVSWYAAVAFCRWLTWQAEDKRDLLPAVWRRRSGWRICLPTEWQWEKAARGHDGRRYPWGGDDYRSGFANIDETYQDNERKPVGAHYLQKTSAVGMYPQGASPYGICDLSGNVWEWCLNEYEAPEHIQESGAEPRVLRGGSWRYTNVIAAAVARYWFRPYYFLGYFGFRVVVCAVPVV